MPLATRKEMPIILKVDLRKAFDSVVSPFLLEVLEHVSFPAIVALFQVKFSLPLRLSYPLV